MKFENTKVFNFEGAFRGMRNPMNSWDKSDSSFSDSQHSSFVIGEKDLSLAQKLIHAGTEHRKFLRQIFVSVDITAPLYWWKEFDTYKVGTTANSTSTMHRIISTPITLECFEIDDYSPICVSNKEKDPLVQKVNVFNIVENELIPFLEFLRTKYKETHDKKVWKELIRWLPESWLQKRTVTLNYENILSICSQRKTHKLNEWSGTDNPFNQNFISWAKSLPYTNELIFKFINNEE